MSSTTLVSDGTLYNSGGALHAIQTTQLPAGSSRLERNSSASESIASSNRVNETVKLYLQYGKQTKKVMVSASELTIPALRLLFVDRFAYPHGSDFPEIYIQDPKTGISYELTEEFISTDLKSGCLLSLHIEAPDQVLTKVESEFSKFGIGLSELSKQMNLQGKSLSELTDSCKELQKAQPNPEPQVVPKVIQPATQPLNSAAIAKLRKDLGSLAQLNSKSVSEIRASILTLVSKAQISQVEAPASEMADTHRAYLEKCFRQISRDSDKLIPDVDDLQDMVEDLRKDVAQRSVRPEPRKVEAVFKDLETASVTVAALNKFIADEKANWKKVWEQELDRICEEQQELRKHEDLITDLKDDLEEATATLNLVKQCCSVQSQLDPEVARPPRILTLPPQEGSLVHVKDAVMSEVSALQPNHEKRVEAIERSERLRKKELEMRGIVSAAFIAELDGIVGEGNHGRPLDQKDLKEESKPARKAKKEKKRKKKEGYLEPVLENKETKPAKSADPLQEITVADNSVEPEGK